MKRKEPAEKNMAPMIAIIQRGACLRVWITSNAARPMKTPAAMKGMPKRAAEAPSMVVAL
jgi:hypothetical protein